jgi:hypothetical protein
MNGGKIIRNAGKSRNPDSDFFLLLLVLPRHPISAQILLILILTLKKRSTFSVTVIYVYSILTNQTSPKKLPMVLAFTIPIGRRGAQLVKRNLEDFYF